LDDSRCSGWALIDELVFANGRDPCSRQSRPPATDLDLVENSAVGRDKRIGIIVRMGENVEVGRTIHINRSVTEEYKFASGIRIF